MQNLLDDLEAALQADQSLISDGKLLKSEVIARADRMDVGLLQLLLESDSVRAHFFTEVDGTLVFDKVKFGDFVSNKAFLPDSYTAFRNRIGLTDRGGRYLMDSGEVVLAWPYKDCVLEGGMTKEEAKRDEVFWNITLAPDEITRLFEPKALTGFEFWDAEAVAAGSPKDVQGFGDSNLYLKGNNLLALHSLMAHYAGNVKLIYIDPPFNTESDSFRYNDKFSHSTWLTFMKNRLEVARSLLSSDGAIAVHIDNDEIAHLAPLMREVFGPENYRNMITMTTNDPSGFKATGRELFSTANYILIYSRTTSAAFPMQGAVIEAAYDEAYKHILLNPAAPYQEWEWELLSEAVAREKGFETARQAKAAHPDEWPDWVAGAALANADRVFRTAAVSGGAKAKRQETLDRSRAEKGKVFVHPDEDVEGFYILNGEQILFYGKKIKSIDGVDVPANVLTDVWADIGWTGIAREGGVTLKNGKKPERLLRRLIDLYSKPGELVLDFFSGSGTTAAVAHKMGRKWIAVEQLDYGENSTKQRLSNVVAGDQTGISKAINWKSGGSFIYAELAEWNETLVERIRTAEGDVALEAVVRDIKANGYWRYNADQRLFDWDAFTALSFDERKQMLLDSLDANHLYVNYGDISDEIYAMSDNDIRLSRAFYEGGQ